MNDCELLQAYVETQSEDAFAEIVRRHLDLVYSAALRQVGGDAHLAHDVAQTVFNDLARKAPSLSTRSLLSGWLYSSTRFAASKIVRAEQRRRDREKESHLMNLPPNPTSAPDWEHLQTELDGAMHDLKEPDRNAILLRYFNDCSYDEVGKSIGVSADGARMRVDRALEKLRKGLAERGVVSTSAALAVVLVQQSVAAAPAGLATVIASSAVSAACVGSAAGIFNFMAITKMQATAVVIAVAGLSVPIVLQKQANTQLTEANQALRREHAAAAAELAPLKSELERLRSLATKASPTDSSNEVFQLRAEVARLREQAKDGARTRSIVAATAGDDLTSATLRTLGLRARQLKENFERMPETHIPELAFVSEKDWLDAAASVEAMQSDADTRKALDSLRSRAKQKFGNQLQDAFRKFAEANGDALPTDLSQLQPFFKQPVDPAVLQRYRLVQSGGKYGGENGDSGGPIVEEIAAPVDQEYDTLYQFHRNGSSSRSSNAFNDAIEKAVMQFAAANNGQVPRSPAQLKAILPPQIDALRVEAFLAKIPPQVTTIDQYREAGQK